VRVDRVEQLFVRRRAGRIELLMVLESPAGDRERETLQAPTSSPEDAVRFAGTQLARRGIVASGRLRLRVERGGGLVDDARLRDLLLATLAREGAEDTRWE
jgi:hypothetical protein